MDGILLVGKPVGVSSFGVVARVRGIIKAETGQKIKIGHTGTLDPLASGLMILVLGSYTKRAGEFSKLDKTYEAEITLGATSSTADREGELIQKSTQKPTKKAIQAALSTFVGQISQTPPVYSAIKIDGQRAYKMARKGQTPKMEPRNVTIYSLGLTDYTYPNVKFITSVSSGTYIRSLAVDIGEKLGTGAYLSSLKRSKVAGFNLRQAINIDNYNNSDIINNVIQIPPAK